MNRVWFASALRYSALCFTIGAVFFPFYMPLVVFGGAPPWFYFVAAGVLSAAVGSWLASHRSASRAATADAYFDRWLELCLGRWSPRAPKNRKESKDDPIASFLWAVPQGCFLGLVAPVWTQLLFVAFGDGPRTGWPFAIAATVLVAIGAGMFAVVWPSPRRRGLALGLVASSVLVVAWAIAAFRTA